MSSSTSADTGSTAYYAVYRTNVTNYYPSSTTESTSQTLYRNQWFTSTSAMATTVLSSTTTGTSNFTPTVVDGYTFSRMCTAVSGGGTCYTVANAVKTTTTTFYTKETKSVTATFYYNSNETSGSTTVSSTTASGTQTLWSSSTTAAAISNGSITIPSAVTGSVGTYNNAYVGVATSTGTMSSSTSANTGSTAYYAVYRTNVTNYYYGSSYTSQTLYRNQWFTSTTAMADPVLSTSTTGTSNYSTADGPGNSAWYGLAATATTTRDYSSVSAAAKSHEATLFTIYQFNIPYVKGSNVSDIGLTSDYCRVNAKITGGDLSCSVVLPSITPNSGYAAVGWSTTNGDTTGLAAGTTYVLNINPSNALFANAKISILRIIYNANGGTFNAGSSSPYSVDANGNITSNGSLFYHEVNYGDTIDANNGLLDYNNTNYISFAAPDNKRNPVSGKEWTLASDSFTTYSQTDATITSTKIAEDAECDLSMQDCTITLYVNWANRLRIKYNGNGGTFNASSSSTYSANAEGYVITKSTGELYYHTTYEGEYMPSSTGLLNYNSTNYVSFSTPSGKATPTSGAEWRAEANASKSYSQDGNTVSANQYALDSGCFLEVEDCTITLLVNWRNKLRIKYNGNGGTFNGNSDSKYYVNSDNDVTTRSTGEIFYHSAYYGDVISPDNGLLNYNRANYVSFAAPYGFDNPPSGAEWTLVGTDKTYNQGDKTLSAIQIASDAGCNLADTDCTVNLKVNWQMGSASSTDAEYQYVSTDDGWKIRFLTSGTFTPTEDMLVDIFVVGGGGSGSTGKYGGGGGGGGGGRTATVNNVQLTANTTYTIVIGAGGAAVNAYDTAGKAGKASSFSNGTTVIASANGGAGGIKSNAGRIGGAGGAGGSGGGGGRYNGSAIYPGAAGGSYGNNGGTAVNHYFGAAGNGQHTTTCEFGMGTTSGCNSGVTAYAGGGGGGAGYEGGSWTGGGIGGVGGGGHGGSGNSSNHGVGVLAGSGIANTGGGGGGASAVDSQSRNGTSGAGGSGIVILRNTRFTYVYTASTNTFQIGNAIPTGETTYDNYTSTGKNIFLRHTIENNVITESYVGFIKDGNVYYLQGGDNGDAYTQNKSTLDEAFTSASCTDNTTYYYCSASGLHANAYAHGYVDAYDGSWDCGVDVGGNSDCIAVSIP